MSHKSSHSLAYTLKGQKKSISCLKFSPNGQFLLLSFASSISLFKGRLFMRSFQGHKDGVNDLSWHSSSTQFASGSDDKTVKIWSLSGVLKTLRGHTNYILSVDYNPNGNMIVSGGVDESIRIWQVSSGINQVDLGNTIRIIQAHSDPISAVRFSLDGTLILSSSFDGLVRLWDTATGQCMKTLADDERAPVTGVHLSKNNAYILTAGLDGLVKLWEFKSAMIIKTFKGHVNSKYSTGFGFIKLGDSTGVYVGSEDGKVYIYDLETREILEKIDVGDKAVVATDVLDGLMATGQLGIDPVVKVWQHTSALQEE